MFQRSLFTKLLVAGSSIIGTCHASADKPKGIDEYEPISSSISRQTTALGIAQRSDVFCNPAHLTNCFTAIRPNTAYIWDDAYDTCTSLGLEFAIFEDVDEQQYLMNEMGDLAYCDRNTAINMRRADGNLPFKFKNSQGNFIDLDGNFEAGYAGWGNGEPNNGAGIEDCVQLYGENGVLNDISCTSIFSSSCFLCGSPITQTPTSVPTSAPTLTQATTGSFEIYSKTNVTVTAISATTITLTQSYNASNRVHDTSVFSRDCVTQFDGPAVGAFTLGNTDDVSSGDGFITYNITIEVNITKINDSTYWSPLSSGGLGGTFDMCLEEIIYFTLPDDTVEKMNFVNTNLTVTVEMDADFTIIGVDAERKDETKENLTFDYSQYVTAYQCTNTNLESETTGLYSQGDELKICVTSRDSSIVQVGSIKRLMLSQAAGPGAGADFAYITDGEVVDDEIAATTCAGTVCHATMQLLGRYFAVDEPGELTASGSVELTFDTGRRLTVDVPIAGGFRGGDLSLEDSARRMQKDKLPDESAFAGVKVSLKSVNESGGTSGCGFNGVTLLSGLVTATGSAILMV